MNVAQPSKALASFLKSLAWQESCSRTTFQGQSPSLEVTDNQLPEEYGLYCGRSLVGCFCIGFTDCRTIFLNNEPFCWTSVADFKTVSGWVCRKHLSNPSPQGDEEMFKASVRHTVSPGQSGLLVKTLTQKYKIKKNVCGRFDMTMWVFSCSRKAWFSGNTGGHAFPPGRP